MHAAAIGGGAISPKSSVRIAEVATCGGAVIKRSPRGSARIAEVATCGGAVMRRSSARGKESLERLIEMLRA